MIGNFSSWFESQVLSEANRRAMMGYENPTEPQKVVKKPMRGDLVISSPSLFFERGKQGGSLRTVLPSLYRLTSDQVNGLYQARRFMPSSRTAQIEKNKISRGNHPTFNADDIMYDVSFRYPDFERTFGGSLDHPANVWLYIPPDQERYKKLYMSRFMKANPELAGKQQPNQEDQEQAQQLAIAKMLGGDELARQQGEMLSKKAYHSNLDAQRSGLIRPQIDADDPESYVTRVMPPVKPKVGLSTQELLSKIRQVNQQPAAAPASEEPWNKLFGRQESYRYF